MDTPKQSPPVSVGDLLLSFRRKISNCAKRESFEQELTFPQIETLMLIGPKGKKTMESIAAHFGITPPSATSLIGKLERKGYVVRKKDPTDRRIVSIELSPQTKKEVASLWKKKEKILNGLISKLSETDRNHFIRIMQALIAD